MNEEQYYIYILIKKIDNVNYFKLGKTSHPSARLKKLQNEWGDFNSESIFISIDNKNNDIEKNKILSKTESIIRHTLDIQGYQRLNNIDLMWKDGYTEFFKFKNENISEIIMKIKNILEQNCLLNIEITNILKINLTKMKIKKKEDETQKFNPIKLTKIKQINGEKLNLDSLKLYYYIYLKLLNSNFNSNEVIFEFESFVNYFDIKNKNYISVIRNSIEELSNSKIIIKDFIDENNNFINVHRTCLLSNSNEYKKGGKQFFNISITEPLKLEIKKIITKEYTLLSLENFNSLSTANHIRLYEFVKSYKDINISLGYDLKDLNELFMTNFKFISDIEPIIKRAIKSINKNTDIELSYEKDKKRKTITFNIIKQRKTTEEELKQKYAISKNIEEKEIIDNIMNQN